MDRNDIFIDIDTRANRMEENQAIKLWDELNKKENIFYEGLKIMANDLNLNMDSINNNLDDLLSRHGMEITDLTGTATDAPGMDSHRGEPDVTER